MFATEGDLSAAVLFMVLGRVRRRALDAAVSRQRIHAVFDFEDGLRLTAEASSHRWSSLHLVRGKVAIRGRPYRNRATLGGAPGLPQGDPEGHPDAQTRAHRPGEPASLPAPNG